MQSVMDGGMDARTDAEAQTNMPRTDAEAQTNMPPQLLRSWAFEVGGIIKVFKYHLEIDQL